MYDWLRNEARAVRTRDFHKFGPAAAPLEMRLKFARFPPSYLSYLGEFGDSWLFREFGRNNWEIRVFGEPIREIDRSAGVVTHEVGWWSEGTVCLLDSELVAGREAPVRSGVGRRRELGPSFAGWLEAAAARARRAYGKRGWKRVVDGPPPFSPEEREIVVARSMIEWRIVGVTEDRRIRFRVTNQSRLQLRGFSVGVRGSNLVGSVRIPIADLVPGATGEYDVGCYSEQLDPADAEVFQLPDPDPDPEPETRGEYWELKES